MQFRGFFSVIVFSLFVLQGCKYISGEKVTINGNFTNLSEAKLYIYLLLPASKPLIDSVITDASGNFNISIPVKKAGFYTLMRNSENEITLVVSPGEVITLKGNGNDMRKTYTVEGSKDSKFYSEYNKFTNANLLKVDSLSRVFAESHSNPDFSQLKQQLDSAYLEVFNSQKEEVISFVNNHLTSLASLLVISGNFGPNPLLSEKTHPGLFLKLDSALFHAHPENSLVNTFHLRMLSFKAEQADIKAHDKILMPGMPAPEITLPNSASKEVKLSSLQGKLTLVYFWSSWNAVCRQTNMNLTSIYSRNHDHGFEIYAVSIDSDTDLWKKAYMLDKAYWNQVIDTKGLESEYCKTYAVRSIPKLILIGKNGKIVANDPEFNELEELIRKNI
jgi:peroxiredoxin